MAKDKPLLDSTLKARNTTDPPPPMAGSAGSGPGDDEIGIDFRHIGRVVLQHTVLILFCVIISIGLAAFQLKRSMPVYSTTAVIKFEPQGPQVVDFGERSSVLYQRDEIRTAVELVRSPAVASRVIDALGTRPPAPVVDESPLSQARRAMRDMLRQARTLFVSYDPPVFDEESLREQVEIENLLSGLRVNQRGDTKLIAITYSGRNPAPTARVANEFANQFIHYLNDDKTQAIGYARLFLTEQVDAAKNRLEQAERALYEYSGQSDLRVMDENLSIAIRTMTSLNEEIERLRNEIALQEAETRALDEELVQPTVFSENSVIASLMRRLTDLEIERHSKLAIFEGQAPEILRIQREMESIRSEVNSLTSDMITQSNARLAMARYRLEALEGRLNEQREKVNDINAQMIGFGILKREVDSAELLYTSLLDQYKRIEVKDELNPSNVTIVSRAPVPTIPTSPKVTRTVMYFMAGGLIFGIALAFVLSWSDRSVKDPRAIEERYGLPALGFIPYIRRKGFLNRKARKTPALVDLTDKTSSPEAFHYLRTSLQYSSAERPPSVILVTSCIPQEGKSTVSSNLAMFYAQRGSRTLLIDADLKRPTIHSAFDIPRIPGLSDVLTGQVSLEDAIVSTEVDNLEILPAGAGTPAPVNLLDSKAMNDALAELRGRYETILIDSAPAHGMADSLVLCTRVDGVCLVVRRGKTLTEVLLQTAAKIQSVNGRILGVIYNHGRERRSEKSFGYGSTYIYTYKTQP